MGSDLKKSLAKQGNELNKDIKGNMSYIFDPNNY